MKSFDARRIQNADASPAYPYKYAQAKRLRVYKSHSIWQDALQLPEQIHDLQLLRGCIGNILDDPGRNTGYYDSRRNIIHYDSSGRHDSPFADATTFQHRCV